MNDRPEKEFDAIYQLNESYPKPHEEKAVIVDPRIKPTLESPALKLPSKIGATEWHDPWMRKQSVTQRSDAPKQTGLEAISDSDSSSSDSESDSGILIFFLYFLITI